MQIILLAALLATAASSPIIKRTVPAKSGYTTTWSDDFTGTSLSTANWKYDVGTGYGGASEPQWGTGEVETMAKSNIAVTGGNLVITPKVSGGKWTSGRIETVRSNFVCAAKKKMMIEASIYMGNTRQSYQQGIWPAFWAMGAKFRTNGNKGWPATGEWDIAEAINGGTSIYTTIHCGVNTNGPCNEPNGRGFIKAGVSRGAFHTYSFLVDRTTNVWTTESVTWFVDGVQLGQITGSVVNNQADWIALVQTPFFLIFDVAVGGAFPDAIAGTTTPTSATTGGSGSQMTVDYVAVYNSK